MATKHRLFSSKHHGKRRVPFDLGIEFVKQRVEVAAVVGVEPALESFDVLLRHRLLRKPGGFEGFGAVKKDTDTRDLAVYEAVHGSQLHVGASELRNLDTASSPACAIRVKARTRSLPTASKRSIVSVKS